LRQSNNDRLDTADGAPPHRRSSALVTRRHSQRFKIDAAIVGRKHMVLIFCNSVV
jgi:hypothetical protein